MGFLETAAGQLFQFGVLGVALIFMGWTIYRLATRNDALQSERLAQTRADLQTMAEVSRRMSELALAIDNFNRAQELRAATIEKVAQVVEQLNRDQNTYQDRITEKLAELRTAFERRGGLQ